MGMKNAIKFTLLLTALIGAGVVFTNTLQRHSGSTLRLPGLHLPSIPLPFGKQISLSGQIAEQTRQIGDFEILKIPGTGKVTIHIGDHPSLKIRADQALLENITTEQEDKTLILSQKNAIGFTFNTPIEFEITTPSLRSVSIAGSAAVTIKEPLRGKDFSIEIAGSGDIRAPVEVETLNITVLGAGNLDISGRAERLSHKILGSGDLKGENLNGTEASITILGSGNSEIGTFKNLDVTIAGSGDVIYSGTPSIQSKTPGSGRLRSR